MKQILVIGGNGGIGKTVVAGSFAALAENRVMADCDTVSLCLAKSRLITLLLNP